MKPFPLTTDFIRAAERIVWFEDAQMALADPIRFLAYAMRYATAEDMALILSHTGPEGLVQALDAAPPGIIDERSWAYWNAKVGRYPAPAPPKRLFG